MGRGFILGALWGLVVAIVTVSITSLMQGGARINATAPQASAVEVPAGTPFNAPKPEQITVVPQTDSAISGDSKPATLAQSNEDQQPASDISASIERPRTGDTNAEGMVAPEIDPDSGPTMGDTSVTAVDSTISTAPVAPEVARTETDSNPVTPSEPAPAPVDVQTEVQALPTVQDPANEDAVPQVTENQSNEPPAPVETVATPDQTPAPAMTQETSTSTIVAQTDPEAQPILQEEPSEQEIALPNTETPVAPATEPGPQAPETTTASETPPVATPEETEKPSVVAETEAPTAIRSPVFDMGNLAPNIPTTRLPSIAKTTDASTAENVAIVSPPPKGALFSNSVTYDVVPETSLMSIILIDDGNNPISDATLHEYPVPVAFAIDASRDDASRAAKRYRDAGFEVLMLTNFPVGATPADIEQSFQAYEAAMPDAIAVLDQDKNGFRRGRDVITQVAEILAQTGHGLVTLDRGLNTPQKIAAKEGVPAALIYRGIDDKDENSTVIRRYLNRAAFQAAQKGNVILVGRTRPETVEALLLWSTNDKASALELAPVSSILKAAPTQ